MNTSPCSLCGQIVADITLRSLRVIDGSGSAADMACLASQANWEESGLCVQCRKRIGAAVRGVADLIREERILATEPDVDEPLPLLELMEEN